MRTVLVVLTVGLVVLSCAVAFRYTQKANTIEDQLDEERYIRMMGEEKLENMNGTIRSLEVELKRKKDKIETLETVLEKTKSINADLKGRLDDAIVIKDNLQDKIDELQQMVAPL